MSTPLPQRDGAATKTESQIAKIAITARIAIIEKQGRIVEVRRKFARKTTISNHLVVQRKTEDAEKDSWLKKPDGK